MRLSEISARLQATVVRDAEFFNLGFLFDDLGRDAVASHRRQQMGRPSAVQRCT